MECRLSLQNIDHERSDILELLIKRVDAFKSQYRQNIAIIGHQALGKTSLVLYLLKLIGDSRIVPVFIQIKSKSFELFAKNFIGVLLYEFIKTQNCQAHDSFEFLLAKCKELAPKTARAIININKLINDEAGYDEIYGQLLDLPQTLFDETQKPVLLIFDEFQNLEFFNLSNPFLELSNKIMVQKNTMYVVISSTIQNSLNILSKKLSLLFGNFEVVKVKPLSSDVAAKFIENKLDMIGMETTLKKFLINFCGAYPFYLNIVCEQIKRICLEKSIDQAGQEELLLSLRETMHDDHGVLNQYFRNKYHAVLHINNKNLFPAILLAIANGTKKTSQIGKQLNKKSPEINRHLNILLQQDIISKRGVFNEINDPLFVYWLRFVMTRQQNSFSADVQEAAKNFQDDIRKLLSEFVSESEKLVYQRVKELFEMFENDIVELDHKRFMLTHFDSIDMKRNNGTCVLNARRSKKSWLCCIENNFIDETKIGNFIDSARRKDLLKKIVIALDGIDENAKLKALEAKIWIWNQNTLNKLLALFEKPRLIK